MSTRSRKRQKTDPSSEKPNTKTLFHFFSKSNSNGLAVAGVSSPKTESDSSSINDEPQRKSDVGVFITSVKVEVAPPRWRLMKFQRQLRSSRIIFTEPNNCSMMKEEHDDIDPFEDLEMNFEMKISETMN